MIDLKKWIAEKRHLEENVCNVIEKTGCG